MQSTANEATGMTTSNRKPWLLVLIFIVFCALTVGRYQRRNGDLKVYVFGGERMAQGEAIYLRTGAPGLTVAPFTYPPFFAFVFIPLALLPREFHAAAWGVISSGAFAVSLWMLYRCVKPLLPTAQVGGRSPQLLFWLGLALLAGRHLLSIWELQSHDVLTLLLTVTCIYAFCKADDKTAGVLAGIAAACKATPLFFAPVFFWQRRWAAMTCVVLAAVGCTLLPDLLTPRNTGALWSVEWYGTFLRNVKPGDAVDEPGGWPKWSEANQSLAGTIYRLLNAPTQGNTDPFVASFEETDVSLFGASPQTTRAATIAAQVAVLLLVMWGTRPRASTKNLTAAEQWSYRLGQGAIIVSALPLLSPMSSKSHFGVIIIPTAYCLAALLKGRRDTTTRLLLLTMFVVGTLTVKGIVGTALGRHILGYGTVTWCTVAAMLAAARTLQIDLKRWAVRNQHDAAGTSQTPAVSPVIDIAHRRAA